MAFGRILPVFLLASTSFDFGIDAKGLKTGLDFRGQV